MKNSNWIGTACAILWALGGCGEMPPTPSVEANAELQPATDKEGLKDGKYDSWASYDDPHSFKAGLELRIAELPLSGEVANIPWAGSYWPVWQDGINDTWAGSQTLSPAAKYGEAFGIGNIEDRVSLSGGIEQYEGVLESCTLDTECDDTMTERCAKRRGEEAGVCIPSWWGICHAWAPASILEPEPIYPVTRDGVTFEVNDLKALITLAYHRTNAKFVSLRCDESDAHDEIEYDAYDIPTGSDIACKDTNPGTFHLILANYLGIDGESFVEDRTFDNEVWNQPLRGYQVLSHEEVSAQKANELLGVEASSTGAGETTEVSFEGSVQPAGWRHEGPFKVVAGTEVSITMTGHGDADLYVRFGQAPTVSDFACRPYTANSSNETCTVTVPQGEDRLYVSVNGWHAYPTPSSFQVTITGEGDSTSVASEHVTGSLPAGAWRHLAPFDVEPGQNARVVMSGTGDADLYLRFGAKPTAETYHCRSWQADSSEEFCEMEIPEGVNRLYVAINAWYAHEGNSTYDATVFVESPTSISDVYLFNEGESTRFFYFRTAVDFIFESASWEGGNLADRIDEFTGTDVYEYILEVDTEGKITGGEWVGSSKQNHPDFLWLPMGRDETALIADGAISYENVKELLLESLTPPHSSGSPQPEEVVEHEAGTLSKGQWLHLGPYQAVNGTFKATMTGTGDADLYVRRGAAATSDLWECRPYSASSNETCTLEGSGAYYVSVYGYRDSTFTLEISYATPGSHEPTVAPTPTMSHLNATGSVAHDEMKLYTLQVTAQQKVVIRTVANEDVDIYLRMAMAPTENTYDMRAYSTSGNEMLEFIPPATGILHIGVHGYQASAYTLTTSSP